MSICPCGCRQRVKRKARVRVGGVWYVKGHQRSAVRVYTLATPTQPMDDVSRTERSLSLEEKGIRKIMAVLKEKFGYESEVH